jgi:hypothetical protein
MNVTSEFREKYCTVLENEKAITSHIAGKVIDKPQLSLWMILVPVFFVFYFFQFKRYKNGLQTFKVDFIKTRKRVLDAVHQSLVDNKRVDIEALVSAGNVPDHARAAYGVWIQRLVAFFTSLLEAEGHDYSALVKSCYKKKSSYLIVLHGLNTAEQDLNRALFPNLDNMDERTTMAIEAIEKCAADFRRNQAKEIF